jgi:two-component system chemotaxis sensor kinase CheA
VREAGRVCNKKVQLTVQGKEVKVDRSILEEIITPISHIIRNAVDHGIESPEERLKAGKEEKGILQISVRRSGDSVWVEIEDDGRGIDPADIRRVAFQKGYITREQFEKLSDREALFLITTPGFSLSDSVSEISGRGVGMDVVSTKIESLGGKLDIESMPGRFTKIVLRLPMTVAMIHAFLVRADARIFAIPVNRIERTAEVELSRISFSQGRPVLINDHEVTEIFRLGELLHGEGGIPPAGTLPMITYSARGRRIGLLVDSILEEREILVKPLKSPLELMAEYTGSTILEDGGIALILDVENIV